MKFKAKAAAVFVLLLWSFNSYACYLILDGSRNFNQDNNLLFQIFKENIDSRVKEVPLSGASNNDCFYQVDVEYIGDKVHINISGNRRFISEGNTFAEAIVSLIPEKIACDKYWRYISEKCGIKVNYEIVIKGQHIRHKPDKGVPYKIMLYPRSHLYVYLLLYYKRGVVDLVYPRDNDEFNTMLSGPIILPDDRWLPSHFVIDKMTSINRDHYKLFLMYSKERLDDATRFLDYDNFSKTHLVIKEIK
jgi:hypothetical protein